MSEAFTIVFGAVEGHQLAKGPGAPKVVDSPIRFERLGRRDSADLGGDPDRRAIERERRHSRRSSSRSQVLGAPPLTEPAFELYGFAGERWTAPVLSCLRGQRLRFGAIRRLLPGLPQKQLSHTLRRLERDGFAERLAYPTIPPRVEYELTDLGAELADRISWLGRFATERRDEVETARQRFDEAVAGRSPAGEGLAGRNGA